MANAAVSLGRRFFESQDVRRGGPDPALCTDDYRAQIGIQSETDVNGHDAYARLLYAAFPDMGRVFDDVVVTPDKEIVRFRLHGTHRGEFMGVAPTGNRIDAPCIGILQIRDGKVCRLDGIVDLAAILTQIGGLPR